MSGYQPISDYAIIGNLRTVALVGRDGSIDWCCLPEMDDASVFAAILDDRRGGRFRVSPVGAGRGEQRYVEDTNVLETTFDTPGGRLTITDFFPLRGDIIGRDGSDAPPEIHRVLQCEGGDIEVEIEWSPRFDYARVPARLHRVEGGWVAEREDGGERIALGGVEGEWEVGDDGYGPILHGRFLLRAGERRVLVSRWDSATARVAPEESLAWLRNTADTWRRWAGRHRETGTREWAGSYQSQVVRSKLALKLLTHVDTGAIAAAPTTSLPENIGGERNWDYRYTWIRDASLTAQAFTALGHSEEAVEFLGWVEEVSEARGEKDWGIQIMYGLHGETELSEHELPHLEGYRGSRPVRIGNGAAGQRQLDVYGELLDSAWELARRGVELAPSLPSFLRRVADGACAAWEKPDFGIWEVRREPQHFVYSKMMIWVALHRAIGLADRYGLEGDVPRWRRTRERVRTAVLEQGYDAEVGAFVQAFGSKDLDASNLLIPLYDFLPPDDPRVQGTIDRTLETLTENGLVYRYRAADGLAGGEGAFGLCTFWMVDALALSHRLDEAWEIFDGIASRANHVGLFPEQFDPGTGEFLGNFPQAFSHIGLINSLLYLAHAEGRAVPGPPPCGTHEHREELAQA